MFIYIISSFDCCLGLCAPLTISEFTNRDIKFIASQSCSLYTLLNKMCLLLLSLEDFLLLGKNLVAHYLKHML